MGWPRYSCLTPLPRGHAPPRSEYGFAGPVWTIRTHQPHVRFDDPDDARRHRILRTSTLGTRKD
jgi:hypothetical protein